MNAITEEQLNMLADKICSSPFKNILQFMLESHLPLKNIMLFGLDFTAPFLAIFKSTEIELLRNILASPGALERLIDKIDKE